MAQVPQPKSYEQILGDMLRAYQTKTGVNDLNTGSTVTGFFEAVALSIARSSGDVFQLLRDLSVDRAQGDALHNIAKDEGLQELPALVATGQVNVTDTSFTKISTKIYAGANPPNIGSTTILVSDASLFPATGSVYIGRGSPNVEGPLPYSAKTPIGGYWSLTLSTPTAKFHNINESVILAQGGVRNIPAGTVVLAPAAGSSPDINFTVTQAAFILDGETEVDGVQVAAQEPGTSGNSPIGGIREFSAPPFSGAAVTNPLSFTNGRNVETDDELRIRIKRSRASIGLGTAFAIENAVIGATTSDENATITDAQIATGANNLTTLFIDNGTGYEATSSGVGIEVLVDSAIGGENHFQLQTGGNQTSVSKASLTSGLSAPFDLVAGDRLAIAIGGETTEHIFLAGDFASPGGATAYEVVASINSDTTLNFSAATVSGGIKVNLFGKPEENEAIQAQEVTFGRNAAELLGLPSNKVETLRLFLNDQPLSKDGLAAIVRTTRQADWSPSIVAGDTLILAVDNTDPITYTFQNSDFIEEGTYTSVSSGNSLESWSNVFNNKLTGITSSVVGERIQIVSNLDQSDRAAVSIDPLSTLVTKGMFDSAVGLSATGKSADYELSRNTAQISLNVPLSAGDNLTAGTEDTEAALQSARILGGVVTLTADGYFWLLVDDSSAEIILTGVVSNSTLTVSKPSANIVRYTSATANAFSNVFVGDYVVIWSDELNSANRFEARVNAVTATTLDIKITATEFAAAVAEGPLVFQDGFIVVRTDKVPQKFKVQLGTQTLGEVADDLNDQADSCEFSVFDEEILIVKTLTKSESGALLMISADNNADTLSLPIGQSSASNESLYAFYASGYAEGSFPLFVHSDFVTEASASPPDSYISSMTTSISLIGAGLDPNFIVGYLQPYSAILDVLSPSENTPLDSYSGSSITIEDDSLVKRLRSLDRWYAANPLDFGQDDSLVVVLDNDAANETFSIPLYRMATTNTTFGSNPTSFNAYDTDAGPTSPFTTYFPSTFQFDNYKVMMRAKEVLDPSGTQNAILYRAAQWGRSGEYVSVGYIYPTAPSLGISSVIQVNSETNITISLKSGASIPTTIDGTTEWDVTITPNTPVAGVDQVTYSWNGIGTAPGLGGLSGGEYVNIISGSQLDPANLGTFRVSTEGGFAPTSTSFTAVRKNGDAVAEANKATLVSNVFSFYASSATTALDVQAYVAANLSNFIEATIVDDGGTAGTGVIVKSTYEESDFTYGEVFLLDGYNWLASSNISGSPQFVFKQPLSLSTATGYAFNDGEEIVFVPTNLNQLVDFLNILAVTGLSTLGTISATQRDSRLEIATQLLGGGGAVQIVGGQANNTSTPVLGSSYNTQNPSISSVINTVTGISKAGLNGLHSDQWVRLQAENKQNKDILLKPATSVRIQANLPTAGQSTVTLGNKSMGDRYFGKPRNHVRTRARTFKVEKQGELTCFSWDTSGVSPFFQKTVDLDDSLGGTVNVEKIANSSDTQYYVESGNTNFTEVSIGDLLEVQNMAEDANNGLFIVTGVDLNGEIIRVLNPNGVNQFNSGTYTITNNADIAGDDFIVGGNTLTAGVDFTVGGTASVSAQNLASAISALPGVSATSLSNVVTIVADTPLAVVSLVYINNVGAAGATTSGAFLVGGSFVAGDFSCTTEVAENDSVIIGSPFSALNQGTFRAVRRYDDSFYIENENAVEELVSIPYNPISLGFDGTTQFDVDATLNSFRLSWDGTGTEPQLGDANMGDELLVGTDFSAQNQGTWMVSKAEPKLQEVTSITPPQGSLISGGQHFYLNAAEDATLYYVWYKVNGVGVDPAPGGRTGILVNIGSTDTPTQVASATALAIDAFLDFIAVASGAEARVTNAGYGPCTDAVNIDVSGGLAIQVVQQGQRTFLEAVNASAVSDIAITISDVLECHRPPFLTYEYEATIPDDSFVVTGSFLGLTNQDSWKILDVLSQESIVVDGAMSSIDPTVLSGDEEDVLVQERIPFAGYKQITFISVNPANIAQRGIVVFSTRYQANRINESSATQISAVGKLEFSEVLRNGLDSYRYDTGLIGEANRIVYGEPRDTTTYPGVAAAGAEIYIRPPLIRVINVGVAVRLETGIPFAQIVDQVRSNVSALVNSNPIGQPIAISDIVTVVNLIPGVRAMAITSPLYNASNDTINIGPSEKSKILNASSSVNVSQIN